MIRLKTAIIGFCITSSLGFTSCTSGWDSESKEMFYTSCMDDAKERGLDEVKSKSVCDCRLETVQKNYPTLAAFMDHLEMVSEDQDLKSCE